MNAFKKLLLFSIILIGFSSCLVHLRPYKKWERRHNVRYYPKGNNIGGRHLWVRQR